MQRKRRLGHKIVYLALTFSFIFQQAGFAQGALELNLSGYLARMQSSMTIDKFRPMHLRYFNYDINSHNFKILIDKGDLKNPATGELENSSKELLNYFLVGLTLRNESFWVNLRPDSQDQIIDNYLVQTDVGRIMLETDLQLKKDTAKLTSPETPEGREYWNKLYKKAEEIYGYENITIPTLTRPWIVPAEIIIHETDSSAYIYKATLKVMLEQDYLKDSSQYNFSDPRLKVLNEYSSELIRELIIPKLTKEVNSSKRYANIRQVYYSLILSRWFKNKFAGQTGGYASRINTLDLTGLTSKEPWLKTTYFKEYQKSFKEGEYNLKEPVYTPTGQVIRSYFSGGITTVVMGLDGIEARTGVRPNTKTVYELGGSALNKELVSSPPSAGSPITAPIRDDKNKGDILQFIEELRSRFTDIIDKYNPNLGSKRPWERERLFSNKAYSAFSIPYIKRIFGMLVKVSKRYEPGAGRDSLRAVVSQVIQEEISEGDVAEQVIRDDMEDLLDSLFIGWVGGDNQIGIFEQNFRILGKALEEALGAAGSPTELGNTQQATRNRQEIVQPEKAASPFSIDEAKEYLELLRDLAVLGSGTAEIRTKFLVNIVTKEDPVIDGKSFILKSERVHKEFEKTHYYFKKFIVYVSNELGGLELLRLLIQLNDEDFNYAFKRDIRKKIKELEIKEDQPDASIVIENSELNSLLTDLRIKQMALIADITEAIVMGDSIREESLAKEAKKLDAKITETTTLLNERKQTAGSPLQFVTLTPEELGKFLAEKYPGSRREFLEFAPQGEDYEPVRISWDSMSVGISLGKQKGYHISFKEPGVVSVAGTHVGKKDSPEIPALSVSEVVAIGFDGKKVILIVSDKAKNPPSEPETYPFGKGMSTVIMTESQGLERAAKNPQFKELFQFRAASSAVQPSLFSSTELRDLASNLFLQNVIKHNANSKTYYLSERFRIFIRFAPEEDKTYLSLASVEFRNLTRSSTGDWRTATPADILKKLAEIVKEEEKATVSSEEAGERVSSPILQENKAGVGGIDFRALPMTIKPMGSFEGLNLKLPQLTPEALAGFNLNQEIGELNKMISGGIIPSGARVQELVAAAWQKGRLQDYQTEILTLLAEICKLQEGECCESSDEFKVALVAVNAV